MTDETRREGGDKLLHGDVALWQEQDLSSEEEWRCVEDSALFKKRLENKRVFEFLASLN